MKKPFALFEMKKQVMTPAAKKRLCMPMREQASQCEWLYEASNVTPESTLGIAVLQRAILDLITPGVSDRDRRSAAEWIGGAFGDEFERDYTLSFSRIVQSFTEMDVTELRQKIFHFAERAKVSEEVADGFRFQRG